MNVAPRFLPSRGALSTANAIIPAPVSPLILVQHTVARAWRLDTTAGSFHVKQFWTDQDPDWAPELIGRMELERQAISAGIAAARPIDPVAPAYGWAGRVAGHGAYRVYEWSTTDRLLPRTISPTGSDARLGRKAEFPP